MENEMIMVLELCDLIDHNRATGSIKVSKDIFDDYMENSCIDIKFVEDKSNSVYTYIMTAEDDEGICMDLMN